jgi:hypothetical protein
MSPVVIVCGASILGSLDSADLSGHLMTTDEIDLCIDGLKADLEAVRIAAKRALAEAK